MSFLLLLHFEGKYSNKFIFFISSISLYFLSTLAPFTDETDEVQEERNEVTSDHSVTTFGSLIVSYKLFQKCIKYIFLNFKLFVKLTYKEKGLNMTF